MKIVTCMVPIHQREDARAFEHFGSSVLLAIEGKQVLISAAHVVLGKNLWMFGNPEDIPLERVAFSTTSPDLASALNDSTDVGFAELPADVAAMLNNQGFEAWPMKDTAYISRPSNRRAAFSGFPCSKSDFHVPTQRMKLQPGFIEGTLLSPEELVAVNLDPGAHLAIPYKRKKQFDRLTELPMTGPNPEGMSGGPVWRFGNDGKPWLAGVGFQFDSVRELLIGTRIDHVFALIQQQSIEDWIARRKTPVTVLSFNAQTGKLEEETRGPKPKE